MIVIVWHDNGKPGQKGQTEEFVQTFADLEALLSNYTQNGIHVYSVGVSLSQAEN